jgi:NTE family protein
MRDARRRRRARQPDRSARRTQTAGDILNRINEISFNSSLLREMRAIAFVSRMIEEGNTRGDAMKAMRMHAIAAEEVMQELGVPRR